MKSVVSVESMDDRCRSKLKNHLSETGGLLGLKFANTFGVAAAIKLRGAREFIFPWLDERVPPS